jgi:hypothetical protein
VLVGGGNELLSALWPSIQVILQWVSNLRSTEEHVGTDEAVTSAYTSAFAKIASGDAEGSMVAMAHLVDMSLSEALEIVRRTRFAHLPADQAVQTV